MEGKFEIGRTPLRRHVDLALEVSKAEMMLGIKKRVGPALSGTDRIYADCDRIHAEETLRLARRQVARYNYAEQVSDNLSDLSYDLRCRA